MKRWIAVLFLFWFSLKLEALPLGNPCSASLCCQGIFCYFPVEEEPSSWRETFSLRAGYWGDFVFNRHMEVDRNEDESILHSLKLNTNSGFLALNFWNKFDLFTTLGATRIAFHTPAGTFSGLVVNQFFTVTSNTHFSWSLGVRGILWQGKCFCLGAEAQYFQAHPQLNALRLPGNPTVYFHHDNGMLYREWQMGFGIATRINICACTSAFIPYMGVRLSHAKLRMESLKVPLFGITLFDLQSNRYWGWAFGFTLLGNERITVTVEGRYRNEKALFVNTQFRF
jgi:major outer membrane protein